MWRLIIFFRSVCDAFSLHSCVHVGCVAQSFKKISICTSSLSCLGATYWKGAVGVLGLVGGGCGLAAVGGGLGDPDLLSRGDGGS